MSIINAIKFKSEDEAIKFIDNIYNEQDDNGATPLMVACNHNKLKLVVKLVEAGVDINIQDEENCTALMIAIRNKFSEIAKYLIDQGADLNLKTSYYNTTALTMACDYELEEIALYLINKNADIHLKSSRGKTILMQACANNLIKVVRELINRGVNVNEQDKDGWTVLMIACDDDETNTIACLLIDNGTDLYLKNKVGETAVDFIYNYNQTEVLEHLRLVVRNKILESIDDQKTIISNCYQQTAEFNIIDIIVDLLWFKNDLD